MTTDELIAQFEAATLPGSAFKHAEHVQAAWGYLRRYPREEALERFTLALRRFAAANGAPGKYDGPLTAVWFQLIADRMADDSAREWRAFIARHPELLDVTLARAGS